MSKTIATKWYSQALHDMNIAEKNIAVGGYDTSAFLCQQAVS
ncbi:MAG TPA: HEPN domain-containing protein [Spirochaetia bacterium]|nr:HEPN domain-containing protein [Spirochaetia bacterium]